MEPLSVIALFAGVVCYYGVSVEERLYQHKTKETIGIFKGLKYIITVYIIITTGFVVAEILGVI